MSSHRRGLFLAFIVTAAVARHLFAGPSGLDSASTSVLYRGVSLEDLSLAHEDEVSPRLDLIAALARAYVAGQHDLNFKKTLSVSLHEFHREAGVIVIDILGRDKAFAVVDRDGLGGLGFLRAELQFATSPGNPSEAHILGHKILMQRDWTDLSPTIMVSLGDRLAVLEDAETGFRRSFPLGVGAIDRVHFKGVTTIMTPTSEMAVLDKNSTERHRNRPRYFKNKPFIPLNVPLTAPVAGKTPRYRQSAIAFHIWQSPSFQRGFLSHGCMRMRDADLLELLADVEGVKTTIPVKIRIEKVGGADHPFPYLADHFSEVRNFGTAQRPVARKKTDEEGASLTALKSTRTEPPALETMTGMTLDPAPTGPEPGALMERENAPRDTDD